MLCLRIPQRAVESCFTEEQSKGMSGGSRRHPCNWRSCVYFRSGNSGASFEPLAPYHYKRAAVSVCAPRSALLRVFETSRRIMFRFPSSYSATKATRDAFRVSVTR